MIKRGCLIEELEKEAVGRHDYFRISGKDYYISNFIAEWERTAKNFNILKDVISEFSK